MTTWSFDWAVTDRERWPSMTGRVTVLADGYMEAFAIAFDIVSISTRSAMVIQLDWCP